MPARMILILSLVLTVLPAVAQEKVPLTPRFEPGAYTLVHVQELESGVASPGAPLSGTRSTVEFHAELRAGKADAKGQSFELEIKRIRHTLREAGQITSFDSDKPAGEKNVGQPMLRALAGAKFTFTLDKQGKLQKAAGAQAVWERMRTMQSGVPSAEAGDLQGVHDFVLRDVVLLGRDLLPPSAAAGERWIIRRPHLPLQKQADQVQCALLRVEKEQAVVECSAGGGDAGPAKDPKAPPKSVEAPHQQVQASLRLNVRTGLLEKMTLEVLSRQTFRAPVEDGKNRNQEEPVDLLGSIRGESTWTRK